MATQKSANTINPASLSVDEVARLLSTGGGRKVDPQQVQADLDNGAPVARDGRINLIHYMAWLINQAK